MATDHGELFCGHCKVPWPCLESGLADRYRVERRADVVDGEVVWSFTVRRNV